MNRAPTSNLSNPEDLATSLTSPVALSSRLEARGAAVEIRCLAALSAAMGGMEITV